MFYISHLFNYCALPCMFAMTRYYSEQISTTFCAKNKFVNINENAAKKTIGLVTKLNIKGFN